jgi:polysaccharide chain length determinant protein (PEP-CTERM system associated)
VVPGKKYGPEDYLSVVWRRKWFVVVPLVLTAAATFLYSRSLPNKYRSEALVLVIPQQVPEKFITPIIPNFLGVRLDLIRRQILSRSRLEEIIKEFDLYPQQRKVMLIDQVVEVMKNDIDVRVQPVPRRESPNYFYVSYDSTSPLKAMQVADRLASLFVKENSEGRTVQTDVTVQFMQREADDALRQLKEQEGRIVAFKEAHAGELPNEVLANTQVASNARQQVALLTDSIARDRERQIAVERMLADESAQPAAAAPAAAVVVPAGAEATLPAAQQLANARATLDAMLLRLKEDHPDVRILRKRIADLEKKAEAEALQQPVGQATSAAVAVTPAEAARQKRLAGLQSELQGIDRSIRLKQESVKRAEAAVAQQEGLMHGAPGVQSQLNDLMRGYDALKATYDGLMGKLQAAKLSTRLEEQQVSQQFRIVEPPRRPTSPRTPDRFRMNIIGTIAGLGIGLLLAGLLEYRDTSLRTDQDVVVALSLPVLALVPVVRPAARTRRWRALLFGSTATMLLAAVAAGVLKFGPSLWGR